MIPSGYTEVAAGLIRGPRPTRVILQTFSPQLKTVIDLEPPKYEQREQTIATSLGIQEVPIPMSSVFPPSLANVEQATSIMQSLSNRPCLVHCKQGVDRTGVVCAYWDVKYNGVAPAAAYDNMLAMGYHWLRYSIWAVSVHELLNQALLARGTR